MEPEDLTQDELTELSVFMPNLSCVIHREPPRQAKETRALARIELAWLIREYTRLVRANARLACLDREAQAAAFRWLAEQTEMAEEPSSSTQLRDLADRVDRGEVAIRVDNHLSRSQQPASPGDNSSDKKGDRL